MRTLLLIATLLFSSTALAQDEGALADKLNRLERDLNFLQKQVYRSGAEGAAAAPAGGAQTQVGYAQLQEQIRQLRGEFERVQYDNRRIGDELKKLSADVDFRLRALEEKQHQLAAAQAAAAVPATPPAELPAEEAAPAEASKATEKKPEAETKAPEKPAKPAATGKDFPNSNEHYNHAFKLLNEKNYSAAATSFDDFVHKYPNDPLTSNAFYWLGESYYARNDFTRSAEAFRKGWDVNPDGQKAPDNLYKLAMSLANVKRTNEACVVLAQIISKYGDAAPRIREKAITERTALQCK